MIEMILVKLVSYEKLNAVLMLIVIGFALRLMLQFFGQTWIQTKAHTTTILILPIITYVITSIISGNIALSLGMVGALSIVRFRNPVRSPLELSVYFGVITMGIAASVSLKWLIILILAISLALIFLIIANKISLKFFSNPLFISSFSEGNSLSSLTVVSKKPIEALNMHKLLQSKIVSLDEKKYIYLLDSVNFDYLKQLESDIQNNSGLVSTELRR